MKKAKKPTVSEHRALTEIEHRTLKLLTTDLTFLDGRRWPTLRRLERLGLAESELRIYRRNEAKRTTDVRPAFRVTKEGAVLCQDSK